jgi:hypothetical protein
MFDQLLSAVAQLFFFLALKNSPAGATILLFIPSLALIALSALLFKAYFRRRFLSARRLLESRLGGRPCELILPTETKFRKRVFATDCFFLAFAPGALVVIGESGNQSYKASIPDSSIAKAIIVEKKGKDETDLHLSLKGPSEAPRTFTLGSSILAGMAAGKLADRGIEVAYSLKGREYIAG